MRRRELFAGAIALAMAGPARAASNMPLHDNPREIPDTAFVDDEGRELSLDDFRDRIVLLNIWATWCPPCSEEMPTLDRLQAQLGGPDFHVLALSIDRAGLEPVRRFYDEIGVAHLGLYFSEGMRAMRDLFVVGLPTTLLIDRGGREIARLVGPAEWDSPGIIDQIQSLINERSE